MSSNARPKQESTDPDHTVPPEKQLSEEELLDSLRQLAHDLERVPTRVDIQAHGKHAYGTYQRRFGSISNARAKIGLPDVPSHAGTQHRERLYQVSQLFSGGGSR